MSALSGLVNTLKCLLLSAIICLYVKVIYRGHIVENNLSLILFIVVVVVVINLTPKFNQSV